MASAFDVNKIVLDIIQSALKLNIVASQINHAILNWLVCIYTILLYSSIMTHT